MNPKYSIIIPTYNRCSQLLVPCCESIIKYTNLSDVEIIIVANGCTDETKEYVSSLSSIHPQFKLLWMDKASGYAKPTNEGIKASVGEYVILLNNDTVLLPQEKNTWINKLVDPFLKDKKMGITGPMKTLSPSAGRDFIIFFCVMISKEVINSIGLLDESFYSYGEDTDMCCRAEDAGFKIKQVPVDSSKYYAENRMYGDFPIFHEGNVSHKNFPNGEELISKNNEILRTRYNKKDYMDVYMIPDKNIEASNTINIELAKQCDGFMTDEELLWLANRSSENKIILEVGSWHGKSSRAISDNLPPGGVLYCIDTWNGSINEQATWHQSAKWKDGDHAYYEFLQNNIDLIQKGKIIPLRMSSKNAADFFTEKGIKADMIFIDAAHDYDSVKQDIQAWKPVLRDGGLFCGHDYVQNSGMQVIEAVNDMLVDIDVAHNTSIWHKIINSNIQPSKTYDCFPFFNELSILDIRFAELFDVVDRFIIVEATLTHGGKSKPLYFKENLHRYEKYLSKVTHIIIEQYPALDSWSIERHQRDSIMRGLTQCKDNDIIIMGDVDEIPRAEVIKKYKIDQGLCCIRQNLYYYYLNCKAKQDWDWLRILPYSIMKQMTPCQVRYTVNYDLEKQIIKDGGWHFSYLSDVKGVIEKIKASAHQEYNKPEFTNEESVNKLIADGKDLFGRGIEYEYVDIDESYPKYVLDNIDEFRKNNSIR